MPEQITLYTHKLSTYAHRVEIALKEAKTEYTSYYVDLQNKPEWFSKEVNPAGKVPAITYGGPKVPADQPSPASQKIAESFVILEFIADIYPDAHLMPQDPVLRAKARFFLDFIGKTTSKVADFLREGTSPEVVPEAIQGIQNLLPAEGNGSFAIGHEFSIVDAALISILCRLDISLKNDLGGYAAGEGAKLYETLRSDPKYARFWSYFDNMRTRDSVKETFDEAFVLNAFMKRWGRAQK